MGNHDAGRAMVATATALAEHSELEPLAILDIACEPYHGADAEFDDDTMPEYPFGQILIRAFDPNGVYEMTVYDDDEHWETWYEKVYTPFRDRYEFC